jgi:predicted metal-dependent HD superfamily phosphohydrolase
VPDARRFEADVLAVGGTAPTTVEFRDLVAAYSEAHRHYHTLAHVTACLGALDAYRELAIRPSEIAVALWFHDVVYDTRRDDNEARSAERAGRFLHAHRVAADSIGRIERMILATRHSEATTRGDTALLIDIDLGILGQPAPVFDRYDDDIRREYAWVADDAYRAGRRRVLEGFLARSCIYATPPFHDAFEAPARANLGRALARLQR